MGECEARLFAREFPGIGGAHFRLTKRIPAGAGLGGGSADAAAVLVGMARCFAIRLGPERYARLALALGSDVPFALLGGTALGRGRGERLDRLRLARSARVLIAVPSWRVATAAAFRAIDRRKYGLTLWRSKLRFAQSLGREQVTALVAARLGNTFEEALGTRRREFLDLCVRLRRAGIEQPRLTGSGEAVLEIL
jgi:4-diphosphocytidyl-2-C-methyl-D-erythritol kinase